MWIPRKLQKFSGKFQVKDSNTVLSLTFFTFLFLIRKLFIFHGKPYRIRGTQLSCLTALDVLFDCDGQTDMAHQRALPGEGRAAACKGRAKCWARFIAWCKHHHGWSPSRIYLEIILCLLAELTPGSHQGGEESLLVMSPTVR